MTSDSEGLGLVEECVCWCVHAGGGSDGQCPAGSEFTASLRGGAVNL